MITLWQLDWAMAAPGELVKHYSGCVLRVFLDEGVLGVGLEVLGRYLWQADCAQSPSIQHLPPRPVLPYFLPYPRESSRAKAVNHKNKLCDFFLMCCIYAGCTPGSSSSALVMLSLH